MIKILSKYQVKITLIGIVITISTVGANFSNISNKQNKNLKKDIQINQEIEYKVVKVIDGDTFEIVVDNENLKVRMIGVDTPETVDTRKIVQCFGKEASKTTKELLLDRSVKLKLDDSQSKYDKYGRILAYVYRDDGLFINEYLIENGYAHEYTYSIPYKFQNNFEQKEKIAREAKIGLWGGICS